MKTHLPNIWLAVCVSALTAATGFRAAADQPATISGPEKTYTGMVRAVDLKAHTLEAKGIMLFGKKFHLGAACVYTLLDNASGTENDLHPGQKILVSYQNADGVLVADRVEQQPLRFEGWVKAVDPNAHTVTLHSGGFGRDKQFQFAGDCQVTLRGGKAGTLADIQAGNYVTLIYETPPGLPTVQRIAQTSEKFTGSLTAIDLGEKTLKARMLFDTKDFNVGDHCVIVINGKDDGQLSDLKPDDELVFTYDEINGVNVVNRIELAKDSANTDTAIAPMAGN